MVWSGNFTDLWNSIPPTGKSKVKSSVQRTLRQKFVETYPGFEPYIDEILPKKSQLDVVKLFVLLMHSLLMVSC